MTSTFVFSTISGGYFVSQTAILTAVLQSVDKVDAFFGNSGGAIANILSLKYSGTKESIERVLYSIDKDLFVRPWVSDNVPFYKVISPFISLFSKSFYKESKGPKEVLEVFYTKEELRKAEVWIGKYNISANFNNIMCTKKEGESIFNTELQNTSQVKYLEDITGTFTVEYADGDITKISDTLRATSAIPTYKPPVTINGIDYVDGGVASPTPGSSFTNILSSYADRQTSGHLFRMFYVIGPKYIDVDVENLKQEGHWSRQVFRTLKSLLNFSIYKERQVLFDTWLGMTGKSKYDSTISHKKVNGKNELNTFLNSISSNHYFVTCYTKETKVNVTNFDKEELKKVYKESYDNVFFEIFYTT